MIEYEMARHGDSFANVIGHALAEGGNLITEFADGYGGTEGCAFTLWTASRVYFPACHDGSEWVESVPRNPCDEPMRHVGGG